MSVFAFARRHDDPGIRVERMSVGEAATPTRVRRDWVRIVDCALSAVAGALVGVLLAAFLLMGWR